MNGFRGRIGVVIEIAPEFFVSYRLRGAEAMVEMEWEPMDVTPWDVLAPTRVGPASVRMELAGYLDSHERQAPRPEWATEDPQIEARRDLPPGPTRELEG